MEGSRSDQISISPSSTTRELPDLSHFPALSDGQNRVIDLNTTVTILHRLIPFKSSLDSWYHPLACGCSLPNERHSTMMKLFNDFSQHLKVSYDHPNQLRKCLEHEVSRF